MRRDFREEDQTPERVQMARAFFDLYDKLPKGQRGPQLSAIARQVGIDDHTAYRWSHFVRADARRQGSTWPYEPGEVHVDRMQTKLAAAQARPARRPDFDAHDDRRKREVVAEAAQGDEMAELARQTILEGDEVDQVERMEENLYDDQANERFIVFLSQKQVPMAVPYTTDLWILKAYSRWDGYPMKTSDIADTVGMTETEVKKYISLRGWTRMTAPFSEKELAETPVDVLAASVMKAKEAAVLQKVQLLTERSDKRDAEKWRNFNAAVMSRIEECVSRVPALSLSRARLVATTNDQAAEHTLILPLNDWQVGAYADQKDLRFGWQFDEQVLRRMIEDYCRQLVEYVRERPGTVWGKPRITLLGDILHGLVGLTVHGTNLAKHMREFDAHQTDLATELLMIVVDSVMELFGGFKVIPIPGNHEGAIVNILAEVVYQRWRREGAEIARHTSRTHFEMIGSNLFVFDHGATPDSNVKGGKVPRSGPARDNAIKDIVMNRPDLVDQVKRMRGGCYFVQGDQHHTIDETAAHVEVIKLPTLMSGDMFADHNGWASRPAQGVLLVDHASGLKHMERFYLDNRNVFPEDRF